MVRPGLCEGVRCCRLERGVVFLQRRERRKVLCFCRGVQCCRLLHGVFFFKRVRDVVVVTVDDARRISLVL